MRIALALVVFLSGCSRSPVSSPVSQADLDACEELGRKAGNDVAALAQYEEACVRLAVAFCHPPGWTLERMRLERGSTEDSLDLYRNWPASTPMCCTPSACCGLPLEWMDRSGGGPPDRARSESYWKRAEDARRARKAPR